MDVRREEKLVASQPAAQAAKRAFMELHGTGRPDRAFGLTVDEAGDGWAFSVLVRGPGSAEGLPSSFEGYPVRVQEVGSAEAY